MLGSDYVLNGKPPTWQGRKDGLGRRLDLLECFNLSPAAKATKEGLIGLI